MAGRKSVLGIAVLCALIFGALASSASAEETAWECTEEAEPLIYQDAHCLIAGPVEEFGTVEFAEGKENKITGTNAATASGTSAAAVSKLKGALSGVVTEVQCTGLEGTGQLTNAAASVTGTGVIKYTGCSVTAPAGKGCVVTGGTVTTKTLKGTTVGQAANKLKFSPNSGTEFASVPISSCSIGSLNNTFPVTGSLVADVSGATTVTTEGGVTGQNTLKFGGVNAGIEGALTIEDEGTGDGVVLMP
jgi:hypothetical protein